MTRVMIGWVMIVDTSGCLLRASSPLTVTHSSVDAPTRPSRGNVGERERALRSLHLFLVDDRDSHVGAPQALVDEAARTAAGGLLCCLVDGKPRLRVQIAIARAGVLAVALEHPSRSYPATHTARAPAHVEQEHAGAARKGSGTSAAPAQGAPDSSQRADLRSRLPMYGCLMPLCRSGAL